MAVLERPEPSDPGPGEVVVTPQAVGICGSDSTSSSVSCRPRPAARSSRASRGTRSGRRSRPSARIARPSSWWGSAWRMAATGVRRVLSVQRRPSEHVRLLRADRHPQRRRPAGAALGAGRAGLPDPRRRRRGGGARRTGVDRRASRQPRGDRARRARRRAGRRADRAVHLPGGARARRGRAGHRPPGLAPCAEPRHGGRDARVDRPRRGGRVELATGPGRRVRRWRSTQPERRRRSGR